MKRVNEYAEAVNKRLYSRYQSLEELTGICGRKLLRMVSTFSQITTFVTYELLL